VTFTVRNAPKDGLKTERTEISDLMELAVTVVPITEVVIVTLIKDLTNPFLHVIAYKRISASEDSCIAAGMLRYDRRRSSEKDPPRKRMPSA